MGRYQEAQGYLEESLEIARKADDKRTMASVMHILTLASLGQGDRAAARYHSEAALELACELGDSRRVAVASNALAQLNRLEGKLDEAEQLYLQTVSFGREQGDREMTAIGMLNLAMVAVARGAAGRARELLVDAISIATETESTQARQSALEVTAGLAAALGEWERSARFFGAAEARKQSTGIKNDPADDAFLQPFVAEVRAALGESGFTAAEASGRTLGFLEAVAEARAWLSPRPGQ
jgi:tetratricopeptide (TPR) repeat protein